jgi:S-adenosylmethionine hydrolase
MAPLVTFLSDFGTADPSVAACKGVILQIAPNVRLLDISHDVARHAVEQGAALLWAALPYVPVGVHLAVVDPGVGTARRPIVIRSGRGDYLVGPDNGLLVPAAERLGGLQAAHLLANEEYRLKPVSATFHGRDIFAPAAAWLARQLPISALGPPVEAASLVRLEMPGPRREAGGLEATVAMVDTWGNVQLLAERSDLEAVIGPVEPGDAIHVAAADAQGSAAGTSIDARWLLTFADAAVGEPLLCVDSCGRLALAVNLGDAARQLGLGPGRRLRLSRGRTG